MAVLQDYYFFLCSQYRAVKISAMDSHALLQCKHIWLPEGLLSLAH